MKTSKPLLFFVFLSISSLSVQAHLIGGEGFSSGFLHPLLGLDHLLAMIAVGVLSAKIGGRAVFALPAMFVFSMAIGGTLAILGRSLPGVETAITLSAFFFAMLALFKPPLKSAIFFVALFALFHGHAHGEEMPAIAQPVLYILGFVVSTTALHFIGASIANTTKTITPWFLRLANVQITK